MTDPGPGHELSVPALALRYVRTLRYLRPSQVADQLRRRLGLRRGLPPVPQRAALRPGARPRVPYLLPMPPPGPPDALSFLNVRAPFPVSAPDWGAAAMPKLWRYNLHYFDYLHWSTLDGETKARLIDDWMARAPAGAGDAWEPYPVSLRVVNWLKYCQAVPAPPPRWLLSVARQLAALAGDVEYHLLGNHILKNAKALAMGGMLLDAPDSRRWLEQGLDLLAAQAREQFLADGGHFERSPMYHALCLEDLLDVVNAAGGPAGLAGDERIAAVAATARHAAAFLAATRHADGEIALLNDSAFGIAPGAGRLLAYARDVLGEELPAGEGLQRIDCTATGLFGYRAPGESLILDCGPVGPDYQPGHAHCDTLSFELCIDGRRVIVDSGVHDYEIGPLRSDLRSTAAHNTVRVDGLEQSEVWGAFRVGRRAHPLEARLETAADGALRFVGAHDGYRRLPGRVVHEREFVARPGRSWTVTDRLRGAGVHRAESYLHLAPGLAAEAAAGGGVRIHEGGRALLALVPRGARGLRLEAGCYCPEFGKKLSNVVLVIDWEGSLPGEFGYVLERLT